MAKHRSALISRIRSRFQDILDARYRKKITRPRWAVWTKKGFTYQGPSRWRATNAFNRGKKNDTYIAIMKNGLIMLDHGNKRS
jgi:hypothetical protein